MSLIRKTLLQFIHTDYGRRPCRYGRVGAFAMVVYFPVIFYVTSICQISNEAFYVTLMPVLCTHLLPSFIFLVQTRHPWVRTGLATVCCGSTLRSSRHHRMSFRRTNQAHADNSWIYRPSQIILGGSLYPPPARAATTCRSMPQLHPPSGEARSSLEGTVLQMMDTVLSFVFTAPSQKRVAVVS